MNKEIDLIWEELDKLTEVVKRISDRVLVDNQFAVDGNMVSSRKKVSNGLYLTAEGMREYDGSKWL